MLETGPASEDGSHHRVPVFQHRTAGAQQVVGGTGDAVAGADHAEVFGLRTEPGVGELVAGRSFELFDDRAHLVMVVRVGRDDDAGALRP